MTTTTYILKTTKHYCTNADGQRTIPKQPHFVRGAVEVDTAGPGRIIELTSDFEFIRTRNTFTPGRREVTYTDSDGNVASSRKTFTGLYAEAPCPAGCGATLEAWNAKPVTGTVTDKTCDSSCLSARGDKCSCSCGGRNHAKVWLLAQVTS